MKIVNEEKEQYEGEFICYGWLYVVQIELFVSNVSVM